MSDTNITKHPDMVHIGPAVLCLYDEVDDLLVNIGKTDNIRLAKNVTEIATLKEIVNGVMVETRGQPTGEEYRLRGLLTETLDPNTQRLVMKNCGTPSVTGDCTIGTETEEVQMFLDNQHLLLRKSGFYGTGTLPGAASVVGTAYGAGATIPTGTYVFTVVPNYDGTIGSSLSSAGVAVALGENVGLNIVHAIGSTPTSWLVYVHDTALAETIVDAELIADLPAGFTATSTIFSSWTRTTPYPGDAAGSFTVTNESGLTEYVVGTDYSIDDSCAMFCLVDGGAIGDGQWVRITYTFYKNPMVEMTIGPSNHLPKYVHPVILAFKDDDRDSPVGKGVEIHLYKVLANSGWEWDLSTLNYESGFEFEWVVLLDRAHMNHGHIYTFHRQFSSFGLKDFADLTYWTNAENCVVAAS